MTEQRVGIAMFAIAVAALASWPMPSTDVDAARVVMRAQRPTATVDAPTVAVRRSNPRSTSRTVAVAPVADTPMPEMLGTAPARWELIEPEKSLVDWNAEMGEVLTAYEGCAALQEADEDSPVVFKVDGLRHMFDDPGFNPNDSVGTYQIASDATNALREVLETEGCI